MKAAVIGMMENEMRYKVIRKETSIISVNADSEDDAQEIAEGYFWTDKHLNTNIEMEVEEEAEEEDE